MLNELLRVVNACDFTSAVDRSADPAPTLDALLTGIQQLRDQMLQFLCDLSLLQVVEPRPGEKFDRIRCMAVGTTHAADTTNAVVSEVVECGFVHNDQVVKQAKVKLATPETPEGKR
jgi:molecular chaperone GrpE (heat shock protein)